MSKPQRSRYGRSGLLDRPTNACGLSVVLSLSKCSGLRACAMHEGAQRQRTETRRSRYGAAPTRPADERVRVERRTEPVEV
ncbi:MAG: hypothetical protein KDJ52_35610 [Anaerolineae bacterium]|nr:hypothetical protein [Anaerolineae bacterium]